MSAQVPNGTILLSCSLGKPFQRSSHFRMDQVKGSIIRSPEVLRRMALVFQSSVLDEQLIKVNTLSCLLTSARIDRRIEGDFRQIMSLPHGRNLLAR